MLLGLQRGRQPSVKHAHARYDCVFVHIFTWIQLCGIQQGVMSGWSREKNKVRIESFPRGPGYGLGEDEERQLDALPRRLASSLSWTRK